MANTAYQSSYTGAEIDAAVGAVANKAEKATTLSGYGITDAYTKDELVHKYYGIGDSVDLALTSSNTINLNSFITLGTYHNGYDARSTYCSNRPTTNNRGFKLYVMSCLGSGTTYVRQRYQERDTSTVYERYTENSGSTWTDWVKVQGAMVSVYSGSSAPSSSTGSDGDIYIQTS